MTYANENLTSADRAKAAKLLWSILKTTKDEETKAVVRRTILSLRGR